MLGASPYFMKAIWRTKALLGHAGSDRVSEFLWQQLRHSPLNSCVPAFYGNEDFAQRYLPSDRNHGVACASALEETQPSPVRLSVQSYSFLLNGGISSVLLRARYIL